MGGSRWTDTKKNWLDYFISPYFAYIQNIIPFYLSSVPFLLISELEVEEGGFGFYGEKTRYASLQKKRDPNVASQRGYETMRNLRTNIPSLVR